MKRSDAEESLQEFLDTVVYGDPNAASAIIFHLEHIIGMLPPLNNWSLHTDGDHADSKSIIYRTWEDE